MPYTTLRLEQQGPTAILTLHRPEVLHALNSTMFDELEAAFSALAASQDTRCILLTGSGDRAFAAGADIRELQGLDAATGEEKSRHGHRVLNLIERCGIPTIACLNGVALGGGCELALACTMRLASTTAKLGLPETKLGLIPGYGGTQRLTRLVGPGNALRMMLTGDFLPATEALRIGLVQEVVPPDRLLPRAHELAAQIAAVAPLAVSAALEAVQRGAGRPLDEALQIEFELFGRLCATADAREGIDAFLTKCPPAWQGR